MEQLLGGQLTPGEAVELRRHLGGCSTCRERLEELEQQFGLLDKLRALSGTAFAETAPTATSPSPRREVGDETVSANPSPSVRPMASFPGYRLVRELNHGGQGVVYEAIQGATKRKVALKVLLPGIHASQAARRRFEREIEIIAQLRHPNIVAIYDAGQTPEGRCFYAMDYIRGLPLHQHVTSQNLTVQQTLQLFLQICDALQYAHQRGVIHRDLKPSNILVEPDGTPRVLDFGLAKQLSSTADTLTLSEQIFGTLPYMAPEQTRGRSHEVDTRTDVYALGVILYQLLTGKYPYPVIGQLAEVLQHIAQTPPERPTQAWAADRGSGGVSSGAVRRRFHRCPINHDLETIVLKALAKESERRYQSAGELSRDIERLLRHEPIEAKRDSAFYVFRKMVRQHRARAAALASLLIIMMSSGWLIVIAQRQTYLARYEHDRTIAALHTSKVLLDDIVEGDALDAVREQVLSWFLVEWHAGRTGFARALMEKASPGSAQRRAMQFLLDEHDDSDAAEEQLLVELPEQHEALALFVIGERRVQDGRLDKAQQAFELCQRAAGSGMIKKAARARLDSLTHAKETSSAPDPNVPVGRDLVSGGDV